MSQPQRPQPAKLVIGFFLKEKELVHSLGRSLVTLFGSIDMISHWFDFKFTNYYTKEMGEPLFRRVFSFKDLIQQQDLAHIKLQTNQLEHTFESKGRRRVNLDPGYLLNERFVLATGKNFAHRIYLKEGIYADLTLIYKKGGFRSLPWTYPDYAHPDLQRYLMQVRMRYNFDLKRILHP
jgi:hypothetical protein